MLAVPWFELILLLLVGGCAGFLMHRSDFCMAGAFRDLFLFGDSPLMRPLVLLVSFSALLFELGRANGLLPYYPFPWFAPPSLTNLFGGVLFGVGMVLAGGCVVGVLYKLGSGNLLAGIAFLGLLAGGAVYAEIHPLWIRVAAAGRFAGEARTLPQWIGSSSSVMIWVVGMAGVLLCIWWGWRGRFRTLHAAEGYFPPWQTSLLLAGLSVATVLVVGLPMGVTTTYAKFSAWLEALFVPDHVAGLAFFKGQPISYRLPLELLPRSGGAGPVFDVVAIVQLPLIGGIICGAFASARLLGEFRPHWSLPPRQVAMVFVGGLIMALGSRMTPGCNLWHIMGGLPLLTIQSLLFVTGLLPGAWLGSRLLQKILV